MSSTFCWEPFPDLLYFSCRTLRFIHPWLSPCTGCYHKLLSICTHGPEQLSHHNASFAAPSLRISTFYIRFYFFFPMWTVPCIFNHYCFLIIFFGTQTVERWETLYLIIVFKQKANASSSVCWLFVLHLILPLIVCVLPSYQCQGRLNTKCFLSKISKQCTLCAWTK